MKFIEIERAFKKSNIIDVRNVINFFTNCDRRRFYEWQKKGYIKKIANNYYIFADAQVNDELLKEIANKIYTPSYIGVELALSHYGFIPEAVFKVTSVTARKTKNLNSPIAQFSYRNIKRSLFWGYHLNENAGHTFLISSPEKTILDYLYLNPNINDEGAFQELRFNQEQFTNIINIDLLREYLKRFSHKRLEKTVIKLMRFLHVRFQ